MLNIVRSAVLLLGLFGLCAFSPAAPIAWAPGNPLPTPCSAQAAIEDAAGVTFFLLGGNCPANPLIGSYSSTAFPTVWSDLAIPLDTTRIGAGAAINPSVTNEELVYGGAETGNSSLNTAGTGFLYDPNGDFFTVASMSVARSHHGYASVAGRAYAIGGIDDSGNVLASVEYFGGTGPWHPAAPLPVATRESAAALGADGNFYVVDAHGHLLILGGIDQTGKIVATTWATQALNQPDLAPSFTSVPATTGNSSVLYTYPVTATGNPQPVLARVAGPAGMTFNPTGGAAAGPMGGVVSWTPTVTQTGPFTGALSATNRAGTVSQTFTITVQGPAPTAPTGLVQTGTKADESATVKWNASTVPGGAPIYYRLTQLFCRSGRGGGCTTVVYADHVTGTSTVMTGLKPGATYQPTLSAVANGHEVAGASATVTTKAVRTPLNLKVSKVTQTSAVLTWSLPAGTSAAGFDIIALSGTGAPIVAKVGNVRSYAFTGLVPNTVYNVYMDAFDAAAYKSNPTPYVSWQTLSPPLRTVTFGRAAAVIGQSLVVLQSPTATTATFAWPAATDNVGVAGYDIYYANSLNAGGQPNFALFAKSAGSALQYTLTGLTTGIAQWAAVAAYDAAGNVAALSPAQVVIPK